MLGQWSGIIHGIRVERALGVGASPAQAGAEILMNLYYSSISELQRQDHTSSKKNDATHAHTVRRKVVVNS